MPGFLPQSRCYQDFIQLLQKAQSIDKWDDGEIDTISVYNFSTLDFHHSVRPGDHVVRTPGSSESGLDGEANQEFYIGEVLKIQDGRVVVLSEKKSECIVGIDQVLVFKRADAPPVPILTDSFDDRRPENPSNYRAEKDPEMKVNSTVAKFQLLPKFYGSHQFFRFADHPGLTEAAVEFVSTEFTALARDNAFSRHVHAIAFEDKPQLLEVLIFGSQLSPFYLTPFQFDFYLPPDYPESLPEPYFHSGFTKLHPCLPSRGAICIPFFSGDELVDYRSSNLLPLFSALEDSITGSTQPFFSQPHLVDHDKSDANLILSSFQFNETTLITSIQNFQAALSRIDDSHPLYPIIRNHANQLSTKEAFVALELAAIHLIDLKLHSTEFPILGGDDASAFQDFGIYYGKRLPNSTIYVPSLSFLKALGHELNTLLKMLENPRS